MARPLKWPPDQRRGTPTRLDWDPALMSNRWRDPYAFLVGQPPFRANTMVETLDQVCNAGAGVALSPPASRLWPLDLERSV